MGRTRAQGRQPLRESGIPCRGPVQRFLGSPCAHVSPQPSPLRRGPAEPPCPGHHRACRPRPRPRPPLLPPGPQLRRPHRPQLRARAGPDHQPPQQHPPPLQPRLGSARLGSQPLLPFPAPSPARPQAHAPHSHTRAHTHGYTDTHTASRCSFKGTAAAPGPPHVRPVRSRSPER